MNTRKFAVDVSWYPLCSRESCMSAIRILTDAAVVRSVERFFHRPELRSSLNLLHRRLPETAQMFITGGALRNLIIERFHGHRPEIRDIDIFIDGLAPDFSIGGMLEDQQTELTDLKGIRWHPQVSDLAFDLCRLMDFLVIREGHLPANLENLLNGIDFTMNAVIFEPFQSRLIEKGCTRAVRHRVIDFNSRIIPDRYLIAYRILLMGYKIGFFFSEPVFQYVRSHLDLDALNHLKKLFAAKIGKRAANAIMAEYAALCRFPAYADYMNSRSNSSNP